jgi:hypothetical protein
LLIFEFDESIDMRVEPSLPARAVLSNRNPENLFLIENVAGKVIIHAARDNI